MSRSLSLFMTALLLFLGCRTEECDTSDEVCPIGECVLPPPLGWDGPVLVWAGKPDDVPECPFRSPLKVYEGYDGLSMQYHCPACQCSPSTCVLPGLVAHSAPQCGPGDTTPYVAPAGWNGSCVSSGVVPDAELESIFFPVATQAPCVPSEGEVLESVAFAWATVAVACRDDQTFSTWNCDEGMICVLSDEDDLLEVPFYQCIYKEGDVGECPLGYPVRRVFFQDADPSSMSCTPCECGPPEGGACAAKVMAHADEACSGVLTSGDASLADFDCQDPQPGSDLRGMSATWIQNQPGACTPMGGEPSGEPSLIEPATFCCQSK